MTALRAAKGGADAASAPRAAPDGPSPNRTHIHAVHGHRPAPAQHGRRKGSLERDAELMKSHLSIEAALTTVVRLLATNLEFIKALWVHIRSSSEDRAWEYEAAALQVAHQRYIISDGKGGKGNTQSRSLE
eukprot:gene41501-33248_t